MYLFLKDKVPFIHLLSSHFIHNFYLNVVPASLGELSLPYLLKRLVNMTRSFSVLFINRVFSMCVLLVLFLVSVFSIFHTFELFRLNYKYIVLTVFILLTLYIIFRLLAQRALSRYKIWKWISYRTARLKDNVIGIVKNEFTWKKLILLILFNLGYLTFLALLFRQILLATGIRVGLFELYYIMSLQAVILILPLKSFAGIGTTEGAWMIGLVSMGVANKVALESGVIVHVINLISAAVFLVAGLIIRKLAEMKLNNQPTIYQSIT